MLFLSPVAAIPFTRPPEKKKKVAYKVVDEIAPNKRIAQMVVVALSPSYEVKAIHRSAALRQHLS